MVLVTKQIMSTCQGFKEDKGNTAVLFILYEAPFKCLKIRKQPRQNAFFVRVCGCMSSEGFK